MTDFIEHHSPQRDDWKAHGYAHLQRYMFAQNFARGRVLHVACGSGYGSYVLGARATHVAGVDPEPQRDRGGPTRSPVPYVEIHCGLLADLRFPAGMFSTLVCLENDRACALSGRIPRGNRAPPAAEWQPRGERAQYAAAQTRQSADGESLHLSEPTFADLTGWLDSQFRMLEAWEQTPCQSAAGLRVRELARKVARLNQPWLAQALASLDQLRRRPLPDLPLEPGPQQASALLSELQIFPLLPGRTALADSFIVVAVKRPVGGSI